MGRFLKYCGPKVCELLHLPRLSKATLFFRAKKNEGETPVLFAIESDLTEILRSLDSSGNIRSTVCRFKRQPVDPLVEPGTVT